jgi:iron-sulfur cluster assembly accessory protein
VSDEPVVTVTPAAAARAAVLLARSGYASGGLRVRVHSSGCEGFVAVLDLAAAPEAGELTMATTDLPLFVDVPSMLALPGATLDHRTTAHGSEFVWSHPGSTGACACSEPHPHDVGEDL